ncbi:MAG: hypothetical protein AAFO94_21655, partial [Bacteroidota bacterium]
MQRQTIYLLLFTFVFNSVNAMAQPTSKAAFSPEKWDIKAENHAFKNIEGKAALYLENGKARLKDVQLKNGIIDFDILFPKGRKFVAVHFRIQDDNNYEEFYLRPHQSGNPDATQYTPVFNGLSAWQLYHGKGHSVAIPFKFEQWMHVRLVIDSDQMEIFIDDMKKPLLYVPDLKMDTNSGGIGFGTSMGGATYANLSYQRIDEPVFVSQREPLPKPEAGTVSHWQISNPFSVSMLDGVYHLKELTTKKSFEWRRGSAEFTGTVNLSKYAEKTDKQNAILTKVVINSASEQPNCNSFSC